MGAFLMGARMDNFKAIYTILKALEAALDCPEFDPKFRMKI